MTKTLNKSSGYVMLSVIVVSLILSISAALLLQATGSYTASIRNSIDSSRAIYGSNSGAFDLLECIRSNSEFTTTSWSLNPSVNFNGDTIGSTAIASIGSWSNTYNITAYDLHNNTRTVRSVGKSSLGPSNVGSREIKLNLSLGNSYPLAFNSEDEDTNNVNFMQVSLNDTHTCAIADG